MKRGLALSLTLALALTLLSSCEMFVPGPTERPSNWWESAEPTGSAEPSPSQTLWQEGVGTDFDRRFIHDEICSTEDTVYFRDRDEDGGLFYLIYYMDKATGISLPLCGKPECTHKDENCNAYAQGSDTSGLTNYNGRLYWVGQKGTWLTGGGQWYVFSMAYDGTDRREVRKLPDSWIGKVQTQFHRGYVYAASLGGEEVVNGVAKQVVYAEAYPIEGDGGPFAILRVVDVARNHVTLQAYEEYVYLAFETEDGVFELDRWDTRVGELETLYRGEAPVNYDEHFWVMEDGVIFGSREYLGTEEESAVTDWEYALYRFSFETGGFEPVNRLHISDGYYTNVIISDGMVAANWYEPDAGVIRAMVKDFEGQTVLDAAFEDVEWFWTYNMAMTGYGIDEDYLFFRKAWVQRVAVARDGSGIYLQWTDHEEDA